MIELEIQVLSERREGLIVDIGRSASEHKFALVRHRLVQGDNGALLTLILRGPPRRQQALETALEHHPRITTFNVFAYDGGEMQPHFAAPPPPVVLPPQPPRDTSADATPAGNPFLPAEEPHAEPEPVNTAPEPPAPEPPPEPELSLEEELQRFRLGVTATSARPTPVSERAPEPEPAAETKAASRPPEPFVEVAALDADEAAVDTVMQEIAENWPDIMPTLLALGDRVADGARESTLQATGLRVGAMLREREAAPASGLSLHDAIGHIGMPALQPLVDVERAGAQLHLRHSPLCDEAGHSGCAFFGGLLEGLLGPAIGSGTLSIFPVCCRAYGADDCVLALSD